MFFEEDDGHVIKDITATLERKYDDPVNKKYYSRGMKAFQDNDHVISAMYLVLCQDLVQVKMRFSSS